MELLKFLIHLSVRSRALEQYYHVTTWHFLVIIDPVTTAHVDTSTYDIYKSEYKELASGRVKLQSNASAAKITAQVIHP